MSRNGTSFSSATPALVQDYSRPTPLNADRLYGQVAQKLAVAIISGRYLAGDLLPNEEDLRGEISVSRTAYREAVKVLTAKGLVEARPKSGTRVAPRAQWNFIDPDILGWHLEVNPNEDFIKNLFELRRMIEPRTARLAAQRRTPATLANLDLHLHVMRVSKPYSDPAIRADLAFHHAIFTCAGNETLTCLSNVVQATIQWSMLVQSRRDDDAFQTAMADHQRLRDAIADGEGEMAESIMNTLIIDALNVTLHELRLLTGQNTAN
jgi:GntR family transcriptional regulator, galactonate operon transcriptional repressor